ncbi:MAG TPA: hypothetical protein VI756_20605 [Blastocatellia bacterium]
MKTRVFGWLIAGCLLAVCPSAMGQSIDSITLPIIGSQVTDMTVAGVKSDTSPWIGGGSCTFSSSGDVKCKIKGVIIPDATGGTTGGVTGVAAGLICNGVLVGTTSMATLNAGGGAKITGTITVPSRCGEPIAIIEELEKAGSAVPAGTVFIAVSAFGDEDPSGGAAQQPATNSPPDR